MLEMQQNSSIVIFGASGSIGRNLLSQLKKQHYTKLYYPTHAELDLTNQQQVESFFRKIRPEILFLAAAKVGGILSNRTQSGDFILQNLQIQTNVISLAFKHKVRKLLFFGSSCFYPNNISSPIKENQLLSGILEPTSEAFAVAKIAGVKLVEHLRAQYGVQYFSVVPCSVYGEIHDTHVLTDIIRKIHHAQTTNQQTISLLGSGKPIREFIHVQDLARICISLIKDHTPPPLVNIGSSETISVAQLAQLIASLMDFKGAIEFDSQNHPDGTPTKILNSSYINSCDLRPQIGLEQGLKELIARFRQNVAQ